MKIIFNLILILFLTSACQNLNFKRASRTPRIPVFTEMNKGSESDSNPYWSEFTGYFDNIEITLDNGKKHKPQNPSLTGSLGTYYRMPIDLYVYMMTEGAGMQYDFFWWTNGKVSPGLWYGVKGKWGGHLSVFQKLGDAFGAPITTFFSLQRQGIHLDIECRSEHGTSCAEDGSLGQNYVVADQEVMNYVLGLDWGRVKVGTQGNVTFKFRLEAGLQQVISQGIHFERTVSDFNGKTTVPMVSFYGDLALW